MSPEEKLRAHSAEFDKKVYQLSGNTYLAVGFAASNVGLIVGDDGLIVIDTTESTKAAENILGEFRKISDKPVKTIIYTHSHRDHISGASVFAEGANVEIIAHPDFESDLVGTDCKPGPHKALMARTARQFGIGLEQGTERINLGLGPGDRPMEGMGKGFLAPTRPVGTDGEAVERCGVKLAFHFAPGECADTVVVHLPEESVLFSADNYYASFPNLYAIRGTPYRDFAVWADCLQRMSKLNMEYLAPGHTRPLTGKQTIQTTLSDYEAAIRFVISETSKGMNEGLTADELVEHVKLPDELREKPYLQEYYGTVEWAVRAYFAGTLGWFDGDPVSLYPLAPHARAKKLASLVGGAQALFSAAQSALEEGEVQWALELATEVLRVEPKNAEANTLRIAAMRTLAGQQVNACARNYFLLKAKQEGQPS